MDNIDYSNIDFRLNTLYDYVYNENNTECYTIKPISKQNISLIDLKEPEDFDYSSIFTNCSIKFIEYSNSRLHFKRTSDTTYPCTISIGKYDTEKNVDDLSNSALMNIATMYILSELVISDKIKNILLPVMYFDTTIKEINKINENMATALKEQFNDDDKLYCLITEHYFKMESLRTFINNNKDISLEQWKSICFQVLFALYKITERLPKFRHNMLNIDSIKIYKKKENKSSKEMFRLKKDNYEILTAGLEIKITDFDKSYIKGYQSNSDETTNNIISDDENIEINTNNIEEDNPYYDVYYFFSRLNLYLHKINYNILPELQKFFDSILPKEENNINNILIPINIIKNNIFFENFLNEDEINKSEISSMDIKEEKISRLKNNLSSVSIDSDIETQNNFNQKKNIKSYNKNMAGKKNSGGKNKKGSRQLKGIARIAEKMHKDTSSEFTDSEIEDLNHIRNEVDYTPDNSKELKNLLGRLNKVRKNKNPKSKSKSKGKKTSKGRKMVGGSSEYTESENKPSNKRNSDSVTNMLDKWDPNEPIPDEILHKYMSRGAGQPEQQQQQQLQPQQGSLAHFMNSHINQQPQQMPQDMMQQMMAPQMPQDMMQQMITQGGMQQPQQMPQDMMQQMMAQGGMQQPMMPQDMMMNQMPQPMMNQMPQDMMNQMSQPMMNQMPQQMMNQMPPMVGGNKKNKYVLYDNTTKTKIKNDFFF